MELKNIKSLVELFFIKYKEKSSKPHSPFLKWLKTDQDNVLSWELVGHKINILTDYLKKNLSKGDRCILLSENRPEWLITDISIMNAGGITVPLFTTYSEQDYEYIINDCKPKICIVSNNIQFKKIEKFVSKGIKVLSIENFNKKIESVSNIFEKNLKQDLQNIPNDYNHEIKIFFDDTLSFLRSNVMR